MYDFFRIKCNYWELLRKLCLVKSENLGACPYPAGYEVCDFGLVYIGLCF